MKHSHRPQLAREAKAIVALAFRNGPLEDIHAGKPCPTCHNQPGYSRITDAEMKALMRNAVDRVYGLLCLKEDASERYADQIDFGLRYTGAWNEPKSPYPELPQGSADELREVNRSALIVTPKQPFLDWLHKVDPTSEH